VGRGQPVTRIHARGLPWREPGRGLESTREDCAGEEHARDLGAGGLCCSGVARRDSRWAVRRGRVIRAQRGIAAGWGWAGASSAGAGFAAREARAGFAARVSRRGDHRRGLSRRGRRGDAGWFRGEGIAGGWEARAGFAARGSQAGGIAGGGSLHCPLNS
jgi:hypothetical protein